MSHFRKTKLKVGFPSKGFPPHIQMGNKRYISSMYLFKFTHSEGSNTAATDLRTLLAERKVKSLLKAFVFEVLKAIFSVCYLTEKKRESCKRNLKSLRAH